MDDYINLIYIIITFILLVKILNKAGHSGWHSLWVLVPLVNLVLIWYFAFKKWPVIREMALKKQAEQDVFVEKP